MSEVEITFKREGASGMIAVGSYLIDAAKRCGVRFESDCAPESGSHFCEMEVTLGGDLLTARTTAEEAYFSENSANSSSRLACQVKIEGPGEIEVMTKKHSKPEEKTAAEKEAEYKKEFAELPLEKKFQELLQLEAMALSETLAFVINSPYKVADKIMDVMAEFGFKMESNKKTATRPAEHVAKEDEGKNGDKKAKKKKESETDASE